MSRSCNVKIKGWVGVKVQAKVDGGSRTRPERVRRVTTLRSAGKCEKSTSDRVAASN